MEHIRHIKEADGWRCLCLPKVGHQLNSSAYNSVKLTMRGGQVYAQCFVGSMHHHKDIVFCFRRSETGEQRVGVRRLVQKQSTMPASVISSQSMHLGVLASASHALKTNSIFVVYYRPRLDLLFQKNKLFYTASCLIKLSLLFANGS